jgi:hypothetical protein
MNYKKLVSKFSVFAIALLLVIPLVVQASHAWTYAGFELHWPRLNNKLTFEARNFLSSEWQPYFRTAIKDWNKSKALNIHAIPANASQGDCLPNSNCMYMFNGDYGPNGWLGLASVDGYFIDYEDDGTYDQIHLTVGATYMNDYYFNSLPFYNTPVWRQVVMCQEIGHIFGLGHNDEDFSTTTGTCMDYSSTPDANQHPNDHDFETLLDIYDHADPDTVRRATNKPSSPQSPATWGQLVERHGNHAVYAARNGDRITFTIVTFMG